jgi:hypothetical protein
MGSDLYMNPPREAPKYCRTCRFWDSSKHPQIDWRDVKNVLKEDLEDEEKRAFLNKKAINVEEEYGKCQATAAKLTPAAIRSAPLATGVLFTKGSFGCSNWRPGPGEREWYGD